MIYFPKLIRSITPGIWTGSSSFQGVSKHKPQRDIDDHWLYGCQLGNVVDFNTYLNVDVHEWVIESLRKTC
jgi:hypothetical protein